MSGDIRIGSIVTLGTKWRDETITFIPDSETDYTFVVMGVNDDDTIRAVRPVGPNFVPWTLEREWISSFTDPDEADPDEAGGEDTDRTMVADQQAAERQANPLHVMVPVGEGEREVTVHLAFDPGSSPTPPLLALVKAVRTWKANPGDDHNDIISVAAAAARLVEGLEA